MLAANLITELKKIVGGQNILTSKEDMTTYSYDGTAFWSHMPDVVVLPTSAEEISRIMKLANREQIPVTPRGGGTNISGGSVPIKGGIVLCTTRMNRILEINKTNLTVTAECGVVLQDLNLALAKEKLFFPPDPQSFFACTLGGNAAENAGGPYCVKYGVFKQYLLGMEVVLADGTIMKLGGLTAKNRTGYELMMLMTGSEGTLGIITKMNLKVIPAPPAAQTVLAIFDDIGQGIQAVPNIMDAGIIPAKVEFVDNFILGRIEDLFKLGLPKDAQVLLMLQVDGSPAGVATETEQMVEILKKSGARLIKPAKDAQESAFFWKARSGGFAAIYSSARTVFAEDVTVPRDKLVVFLKRLSEITKETGIDINIIGHAGDGNLHPSVGTDPRDKEHFARAMDTIDRIINMALELGGVLSGEHGVGLDKQRFLKRAMDPAAVELMKKIKAILDPNNILNPGKIWEEEAKDGG
ncbi:MAG: FAD-binding protein [Dehalococcoidales bacterium]|nr:FAD-binding protein [Dehalococcoidales bacterium]